MQRITVKSASRTIQVLELFQKMKKPLRLNEIYKELNYPQSSATNLLKSLVLAGYLNYNRATMSYLPTLRVWDLGSWLPTSLDTYCEMDQLVQDIHTRTGATVGLVSQNDLFIQYVKIRSLDDGEGSPLQRFEMPPQQGTMRLMVDSSGGLAMMSRFRNREIDKIYRYSLHYSQDRNELPSFESLMQEIKWARHVGYAHVPMKSAPELASIAIALDQNVHGIPLAVGVGGLAQNLAKAKTDILRIMREAIATFQDTQRRRAEAEPMFNVPQAA